MKNDQAFIPELLCLIREHAGIGDRMRAQIERSAQKAQAASVLIAEVDADLRQIVQTQRELRTSVQMMVCAVRDTGLVALPPVQQAAACIQGMVEQNDAFIDDTSSASTLLQQIADQLALIVGVLGAHSAPRQ